MLSQMRHRFSVSAVLWRLKLCDVLQTRVSDCLNDVASWMVVNWLQLNHSKTEVLWCSSTHRQHQIPTIPISVGGTTVTSVQPVAVVRNLGIYYDADVTMRFHMTATIRACFATLRQISSIQCSLSRPVLLTLHSSSPSLTIVVLCWPVHLKLYCSDCSRS